ncbi:hypothetical protein LTR37_009261 [Vermiconidia calcicola]|uniref:Uncharacterized protein n=1 Tax=Vermiconidia calcicola TaxID=1690605 RepID=A0ACC3N914_9PEZI|nr:hypothetical protein LTR37_009261 [Vermiconidia calcicola]
MPKLISEPQEQDSPDTVDLEKGLTFPSLPLWPALEDDTPAEGPPPSQSLLPPQVHASVANSTSTRKRQRDDLLFLIMHILGTIVMLAVNLANAFYWNDGAQFCPGSAPRLANAFSDIWLAYMCGRAIEDMVKGYGVANRSLPFIAAALGMIFWLPTAKDVASFKNHTMVTNASVNAL